MNPVYYFSFFDCAELLFGNLLLRSEYGIIEIRKKAVSAVFFLVLLFMRSVFKVLSDSMEFFLIVADFFLRVYANRQNSLRTKVRTLINEKMPLKAHENNVTLNAI